MSSVLCSSLEQEHVREVGMVCVKFKQMLDGRFSLDASRRRTRRVPHHGCVPSVSGVLIWKVEKKNIVLPPAANTLYYRLLHYLWSVKIQISLELNDRKHFNSVYMSQSRTGLNVGPTNIRHISTSANFCATVDGGKPCNRGD